MRPSVKTPALLLYAAVGVLGLFAAFLAINFFVLGRAPALMEHIMGKTSIEIAAFHAPVLTFFVAGFRMFTLLLATYVIGAVILIREFSRGDALAGRVVFITQAIFTPLAAITGMMASLQAPWPVFAVSGVLTLIAFIMARARAAIALE